MRITIHSMRHEYVDILGTIMGGDLVSPRGMKTRELIGSTIVLTNPYDALPISIGRRLNLGIGAFEALQLIGGFSSPELMTRISPQMKAYMDGDQFHGAYGIRASGQLEAVVRKLQEDRDSRQAMVTLWNPILDNRRGMHDYPCTISLHFMIRNDKLLLHTHMRSNDAWLGLSYDAFQFTQLQITLANVLGIEPGNYFHHTSSLHLYERDWYKIDALTRPRSNFGVDAAGIDGAHTMGTVIARARNIARMFSMPAHSRPMILDRTPSENWYIDQIAKALAL